MTTSIDGLSSGLDSTAIIKSIMDVESIPQTLLQKRVTASQTLVSGYQSLNSRVAALADLANAAAKPAAFDIFTATATSATATSSSVTATATSAAAPGQIDVVVRQLAHGQKSVTASMAQWPDNPPVFSITGSNGVVTEITAASTSLDSVVIAIRNAGVDVVASKVAAGTDPSTGSPLYRLQLTSTRTGADAAFSVHRNGDNTMDLFTEAGAATITAAQDATVTLFAGTAAEQSVSSTSNTFSDLLPGLSMTVATISTEPVTVTVARDDQAVTAKAKALVDSLASVFSLISVNSAVSRTTSSTGAVSTSAGLFTGDGVVRDVNQRILSAATLPIGGRSPSEFGISLTRTGTVSFDADKFAAALARDPQQAQAALQTISARVGAAATAASDKYDGQITAKITGKQSEVSRLSDQIEQWDVRLASRRSTLQGTYSALEVQLSSLKAQSTWLASQVAALTASQSSS